MRVEDRNARNMIVSKGFPRLFIPRKASIGVMGSRDTCLVVCPSKFSEGHTRFAIVAISKCSSCF